MDRAEIERVFIAGLRAADPRAAVRDSLRARPLPAYGRLFVLGLGKAACAMTEAALDVLGPVAQALVVTNYENARELSGVRVMASGHPVPDENGLRASAAVTRMLGAAGRDDHVLTLISGGGSALLPAPVPGLSLAEKADISRLILGAGLDIVAMNALRQHLSTLKGGGLLRVAAPAQVTSLILSDVIGDDLRVIASGPTVSPIAPRAQVRADLERAELWDQLPKAAQAAFNAPEDPTPLPQADNRLIGSNQVSLDAMARACPDAEIIRTPLTGDVAEAAQVIIEAMAVTRARVLLFGGETTVTLRGTGRGGRNQELALRVAMALEGQPGWRFLSGGTDGRDGPTDAAGGVVDGQTVARIRAAGGAPSALLANNDSYRALELAGDLLMTGATGTNVADLQILARP